MATILTLKPLLLRHQLSGTTTYTDQKDFLNRYPNSTWNVNTVTIQNVTDASTVSPPGSHVRGAIQ